jgi:hypothetical protein
MVESEEESAPKFLVRGANGDLWLISKDAIPKKVHSGEDPEPKNEGLVEFLDDTENELADRFVSANPGVKLGLIRLDF